MRIKKTANFRCVDMGREIASSSVKSQVEFGRNHASSGVDSRIMQGNLANIKYSCIINVRCGSWYE